MFYMIFVVDVGFVCNKATGRYHGRLRAKALLLHHLSRQVALQRQNHPASRVVAPVILGLPPAQRTPPFARIGCNLSKICGQPARFSRQLEALHLDLRPSILLIVLVNMDQLMVIWLQNEHTQKTRSPHLLLTSPVKRRSQRNASALPNFEIASILGAPSIRRSHISSSRKPI